MDQFSRALTDLLRRPMVDETGLVGPLVFKFEWTAAGAAAGDPTPILTAIREQLGLHSEAGIKVRRV